jgi:hypothetical protein
VGAAGIGEHRFDGGAVGQALLGAEEHALQLVGGDGGGVDAVVGDDLHARGGGERGRRRGEAGGHDN